MAQDALRFEQELRAALDIETRGGLDSRKSSPFAADRRERRTTMVRWSLAAGLVFALSFGGWLGVSTYERKETTPLASVVLRHIEDEIAYLDENRNLSSDALSSLLALFGAHLAGGGLGQVRYAVRCRIRRFRGLHLVVAGERGPVTVLLMPGERLSGPEELDAPGLSGVLIPTGYGSMAVVGQPEESLTSVTARVQDAVAWGG